MAVYTISAYFVASYAHAQIIDKFFTRDGGIVQLMEKVRANNIGALAQGGFGSA